MKKTFFLIIFCSFSLFFAQKKNKSAPKPVENITAEQAMMSDNPQIIASFIKTHPNDTQVPALRSKLIALVAPQNDVTAKPKIQTLTPKKIEKELNKDANGAQQTEKSKQAARVLNHLFDNNPNKKEAYIQIINKSKCNLIVKFNSKNKYYNLDVPAKNKNYILIDKGNYEIATSICDAKFAQNKMIDKDIAITLGTK